MKLSKWIGGGLGWAFGGPIGALIGFVVGSMLDTPSQPILIDQPGTPPRTQSGDFSLSLLVLSAAVMKADGVVVKAELDYVKEFFVRQFGLERTKERMLVLREILKKEIPVNDVCEQIRQYMDYDSRVQLVHMLFGLASSDQRVSETEFVVVRKIAVLLGLRQADFESLQAMFVRNSSWAYTVLEVDPNATDEEVKKAYRKMALQHHPDRVAHLGEEYQKDANAKFQKVNEAWEEIRKQRGLS